MSLDESEVLTVSITKDTDYEFGFLVIDPLTGQPEDISDAEEIVFLFRDDESEGILSSNNVAAALHNLAATGAYVDTGAETLDFAASGNTLTRSAGDWTTDNFAVGDWIRVEGTASNDGVFKIQAVAALILTLETEDPAGLATVKTATDESILGAGITISAPVLPAAELQAGVISVTGPPSDLAAKSLGDLFGAARILRGTGKVQQAPRRSARVRLES